MRLLLPRIRATLAALSNRDTKGPAQAQPLDPAKTAQFNAALFRNTLKES
jgi:hypothetical protein